jgi:hypothetical protein
MVARCSTEAVVHYGTQPFTGWYEGRLDMSRVSQVHLSLQVKGTRVPVALVFG